MANADTNFPPSSVNTAISTTSLNKLTVKTLKQIFEKPMNPNDEVEAKERESAILTLGKQLSEDKNTEELKNLILMTRPFLEIIGKVKAGKLVRTLVDYALTIDEDAQLKVDLCKECIEWSRQQKRLYLRQVLEGRLVRLYNDVGRHVDSNQLADPLIRELSKMDDKELLVEVQLEESKALYALGNISRARTALVSAKTTGNAMYLPPKTQVGIATCKNALYQQAELDMQCGILHAAEDHDFKTAYSYFHEAFENADQDEDKQLGRCALKYMCLAKVMLGDSQSINKLLSHKAAQKYKSPDLDAVREVGKAFESRCLKTFVTAFETYKKQLTGDGVVKTHFTALSEAMIEKELCRLIEPYKVVDIKNISDRIGLPLKRVEKKLALMILDQIFYGCIDQSSGFLHVYEHPAKELGYHNAEKIIHALSDVRFRRFTNSPVQMVNATYLHAHRLRLLETRVRREDKPKLKTDKKLKRRRRRNGTSVSRSRSRSRSASSAHSSKSKSGSKSRSKKPSSRGSKK